MRDGEDINTFMNGHIKGSQDIRVKALRTIHGRPPDLVGSYSRQGIGPSPSVLKLWDSDQTPNAQDGGFSGEWH